MKNALTPNVPFSRLILGLWRIADCSLSTKAIEELIDTSLEVGITTFDHADIYGGYTCEEMFGQAFKNKSSLRNKIQLISKCGIKLISENRPSHKIKSYDTSKEHIISSVNNSLQKLATDYLDLLLVHRPEPLMNADEVAETFIQLKESGKVLNFGVSNFTPLQFDLLQSRLPFKLMANQVEISILKLSPFTDGTLDHCQIHRTIPMAWSPFGGGAVFTGTTSQSLKVREVVDQLKTRYNAETEQILLTWLLKHPSGILPVIGTSKPERVRCAAKALSINLSREEWYMLYTASLGTEVP